MGSLKTMTNKSTAVRCCAAILVFAGVFAAFHYRPGVKAQDNLTPGMLFGPLWVNDGQHVELCASNLGEGDITAVVHFRNITTGEVTSGQDLTIKSGGGDCAYYAMTGRVIGLARGDGRASDWVSPSNALISTMSVVDDKGGTQTSVLGVAKIWLRGL